MLDFEGHMKFNRQKTRWDVTSRIWSRVVQKAEVQFGGAGQHVEQNAESKSRSRPG